MPVSGTWFGLPDFGFTEMFAQPTSQPSAFYNPAAVSHAQGPTPPPRGTSYGSLGYSGTNVPAQGGSVLGASTNNASGGGRPDPSQPVSGYGRQFSNQWEYDNFRKEAENNINSGFNNYFSELDKQMGLLPQTQSNLEGQVGSQYNTQQLGLSGQRDTSLGELGRAGEKVQESKVSSLRDLDANLRNSLQAGNTYLGARGAGDSSAANQMSYAYTQLANKNRGDLTRTANSSLADIELRKNTVNNTYNTEIQKLGEWKSNQLLQVSQYINDKKAQLSQAVAQGHLDRGTAMAQLNTQVMQNAFARLQTIDQQAASFQSGLQQWALNHSNNLEQYKTNLGQISNVQTPTLAAANLGGISFGNQDTGGGSMTNFSPLAARRKDQFGNDLA